MKVVVAQPNKQYCNDLLLALQQKGYLEQFYTLLATNKIGGWSKKLPAQFRNELKKRTYPGIAADRITHFPSILLYHKFFTKDMVHRIQTSYKQYDLAVAKKLESKDYDIIIAYENSNLHTFQQAKKQGKITVLDLAQVHHEKIAQINKWVTLEKGVDEAKMRYMNEQKGAALKYTDYVLTLSSFARDSMIEYGFPAEHVFTANLGINPDLFQAKKDWPQNERFRFLFVGTMTYRKGINLLLQAFDELKLPNVELILIGPMADAEDLMKQYEGLYTYIPFTHQEELVRHYQAADVFVFPSYLDSWAQTVVEAMACGTPAIVTEHTGAKDVVARGGGFVIPPNNLEALKALIIEVVNDKERVKMMGRRAALIAQEYTWNRYHARIQEIVEEIGSRS
ncbi:MAG: glycosyltransferase family 4 protein [Bacteroidota bacterium]